MKTPQIPVRVAMHGKTDTSIPVWLEIGYIVDGSPEWRGVKLNESVYYTGQNFIYASAGRRLGYPLYSTDRIEPVYR